MLHKAIIFALVVVRLIVDCGGLLPASSLSAPLLTRTVAASTCLAARFRVRCIAACDDQLLGVRLRLRLDLSLSLQLPFQLIIFRDALLDDGVLLIFLQLCDQVLIQSLILLEAFLKNLIIFLQLDIRITGNLHLL